jgi:hypothetical protein
MLVGNCKASADLDVNTIACQCLQKSIDSDTDSTWNYQKQVLIDRHPWVWPYFRKQLQHAEDP